MSMLEDSRREEHVHVGLSRWSLGDVENLKTELLIFISPSRRCHEPLTVRFDTA